MVSSMKAEALARRRARYKEAGAERSKKWAEKVKLEAFDAYGGRFCACCKENNILFLSLDRVNNDGFKHQTAAGRRGVRYHQLRRAGWPNTPPLQVLCMNCNWGKRMNGGVCPHLTVTS